MDIYPIIPETITVHLGAPDSAAANITVSFPDYIKNVASSEVYPTWPENAIRANIYAQISFALNRVYTEHYPSLGYDFDITNSTAYDQSFVNGREIFENISRIVDEIFNSYIRRENSVEPLFASYCNGTTVTCEGLSQWDSVSLAEQGLTPYDILKNYYGDNIELVTDAPIANIEPSLPAGPIKLGYYGNNVRFIQVRLNRISANYPSIPKIQPVDGIFGPETEAAVKEFQRIFNLTQDGIVGPATWYKIQFVFNSVKRLSEIQSEGVLIGEVQKLFPASLKLGDSGMGVSVVQYFLRIVGLFNPDIPIIEVTGTYDEATAEAVRAFQEQYGLPQTGVMDAETWYTLFDVYTGAVATVTPEQLGVSSEPFPGRFLRLGFEGDDVLTLQRYLNAAGKEYGQIPTVPEDGIFGEETRDAVYAAQAIFDFPITGTVGPLLWSTLANIYTYVESGNARVAGQYPGNSDKFSYSETENTDEGGGANE